MAQRRNSSNSISVADRLYDKHKEYEFKKQQKRDQKQNNELLGCTFKPQVMGGSASYNSSTFQSNLGNTMSNDQLVS